MMCAKNGARSFKVLQRTCYYQFVTSIAPVSNAEGINRWLPNPSRNLVKMMAEDQSTKTERQPMVNMQFERDKSLVENEINYTSRLNRTNGEN